MRVGVYTECLARPLTGIEQYTYDLVKGLADAPIDLVCFHAENRKHPDIASEHVLFRRELPFPLYHRVAAFFRVYCFDDLDVLHLPNPQFPYVKKPGVPVIATIHDIIPVFMPQYHGVKRVIYFRTVLRWYLRRVDGIIAVSHATKRDLMRYYDIPGEKIAVVHHGIPSVKRGVCEKEDYMLYLGTLEPRKNVEGIIRAFAMLKERGFDYKLVIAGGKGWMYDEIFKLIKRVKDVEYVGYVSDAQKRDLYRKASVFVWPSFYEGFGLPVLEAMAYGTPVVTSNTSSLPEIAGDAAVLVDPYSVRDIARGIREAIANEKKLIRKGFERVRHFTMDRMFKETLSAYERICKRV